MVNIAAVTFSCVDPHRVADFWAKTLGRPVAASASSGSAAVIADVQLFFRRGDAVADPANRIHLDLSTDDLEAEAEADRLRQLGASEVRRDGWHSTESITFRDVEGNEFDLVAE
jgi:hypothetical protein